MPSAEQDRSSDGGRLRLGVVADPGLPSKIAEAIGAQRLEALLPQRVTDTVQWHVQVAHEELPLDEDGTLPLLDEAARRMPESEWDLLVYLTDLPRALDGPPVVADLSTRNGVALISLPAIGGLRLRRHVTETLLYLVRRMYRPEGGEQRESARAAAAAQAVARSRRGRLLRRPGEWASPVREEHAPQADIETSLVLIGMRGRARLLFGMVRNNRPWRLVPHLASATAAAAATAAFGIFYSSIWNMADALAPARLALITVLAISAMVAWLLFYNHLWDPPAGSRNRQEAVLYNASTLLTLTIGVSCMYMLLYVAALGTAFVVIDSSYLSSQLSHPADAFSYAKLVWLATSMGIVAGALGSSLDTEEAVRQATYSARERERQARRRSPDKKGN